MQKSNGIFVYLQYIFHQTTVLWYHLPFTHIIIREAEKPEIKKSTRMLFSLPSEKKINVPFIAYFTYTIYLLRQRKWEKRYSEVKTVELVLLRSAFNFLLGFRCPLWTLVNHLWPVSLKSTVCHEKKRWIKWTFGNLLGYLSLQC